MSEENRFIIVIPFYNVEEWIKYCIRSVKSQKYSNYHCYLVNDISTDSTQSILEKEIENIENFTLINNTIKKYALRNIFDTLHENDVRAIKDDDIVVILDGDDWLARPDVLSKLNNIYNEENCYMTYGSYIEYPSKIKGKFAKKIPQNVIQNKSYRNSEWMSSHLRTFKYKLWKKIKKEDLVYSKTKKFYKAAWDLAFVFPMLEMAGEKAHYVKDILYIYNRQNPLNEDKINHPVQLSEEMEIRNKEKYMALEGAL